MIKRNVVGDDPQGGFVDFRHLDRDVSPGHDYRYYVEANFTLSQGGNVQSYNPLSNTVAATAMIPISSGSILSKAAPNPFSEEVTVSVSVPQTYTTKNATSASGTPISYQQREETQVEVAVIRADGRLRAGDPAAALALLDQAQALAGKDAELLRPKTAWVRGRALTALGRGNDARAEIDVGLDAARAQQLLFEEALLLASRLSFAATLPHARTEDFLFGHVCDAFTPQHEAVPQLTQACVVQDGRRDSVAAE